MKLPVTIYHNPRCSKSRQTLALLEEHGVEPRVIAYLEQPPDAQTIRQLLQALELDARGLMRRKEARYRELGLDDADLSEDALIDAISENPILMERPVVVTPKGAAIGRPPESVLELL